jgi:hypothetical protein
MREDHTPLEQASIRAVPYYSANSTSSNDKYSSVTGPDGFHTRVSFPTGVKPPSITDIKKAWNFTHTLLYALKTWCFGTDVSRVSYNSGGTIQLVRFQVLTAASMKMTSGILRRVVW